MNTDYNIELLLHSVTELLAALEEMAVLVCQNHRVKEEIRQSFENMVVEIGEKKAEMRQLSIETGCKLQSPNSACTGYLADAFGAART